MESPSKFAPSTLARPSRLPRPSAAEVAALSDYFSTHLHEYEVTPVVHTNFLDEDDDDDDDDDDGDAEVILKLNSTILSPFEVCQNRSDGCDCDVCYSKCHFSAACPYFEYLPRGAIFDREYNEVHCGKCHCPFFDTDNWVCLAKHCGGPVQRAKLVPKECDICDICGHTTFECPEDPACAAVEKSGMENYYGVAT